MEQPPKNTPLSRGLGDAIDALIDGAKKGVRPDNVIKTGFKELDYALTGGWPRGGFVILAARSGMGKTAFSTSMANSAFKAGANILYLSLEMDEGPIVSRFISDLTYDMPCMVSHEEARNGGRIDREGVFHKMTAEKIKSMTAASDIVKRGHYWIDSDPVDRTVESIARAIDRRQKELHDQGKRLDLVFIDHLFHLSMIGKTGNTSEDLGKLSDGLRNIGKAQGISMICLAQTNRESQKRDDPRPVQTDLMGSDKIGQYADFVIMLYRDYERMKEQGGGKQGAEADNHAAEMEACKYDLEVLIRKNRNGSPSTVKMFCDLEYMAVRAAGYQKQVRVPVHYIAQETGEVF